MYCYVRASWMRQYIFCWGFSRRLNELCTDSFCWFISSNFPLLHDLLEIPLELLKCVSVLRQNMCVSVPCTITNEETSCSVIFFQNALLHWSNWKLPFQNASSSSNSMLETRLGCKPDDNSRTSHINLPLPSSSSASFKLQQRERNVKSYGCKSSLISPY